METVTIFITSPEIGAFADFNQSEKRYVFDRLDPDGPARAVQGRIYAFVDWVLDDLSGLEMCRRLRANSRTADAHITMVLEANDVEDRRRALRAAADDYMVGPLDRTKALDRVLALQGVGVGLGPDSLLIKGKLEIDIMALHARWDGKSIDLPQNEFRLLHYFAQNPDRVLTRQQLITALGKCEPPIDERTVDVWIARLRSALRRAGANKPIRTVRSLGYVFDTH